MVHMVCQCGSMFVYVCMCIVPTGVLAVLLCVAAVVCAFWPFRHSMDVRVEHKTKG
jgi:hypothetical protein